MDTGERVEFAISYAGRAVFAPFGKWEKAEEGVAYNIPTSEFDYFIDFASTYAFAS